MNISITTPIPLFYVIFHDKDNNILSQQEVAYGYSATAPNPPTYYGFMFTGWDKSYTNITSDVYVYAQYDKLSYTVNFFGMNNKPLGSQSVLYDETVVAPTIPSEQGYSFIRWDTPLTNIRKSQNIYAIYDRYFIITDEPDDVSIFSNDPFDLNMSVSEGAMPLQLAQSLTQNKVHDTIGSNYSVVFIDQLNGYIYHGYEASGTGATVDRSTDNGLTWQSIFSNSSYSTIRSIYADGDLILLGTDSASENAAIFKSNSITPDFGALPIWNSSVSNNQKTVYSFVKHSTGRIISAIDNILIVSTTSDCETFDILYTASVEFSTINQLAETNNKVVGTLFHNNNNSSRSIVIVDENFNFSVKAITSGTGGTFTVAAHRNDFYITTRSSILSDSGVVFIYKSTDLVNFTLVDQTTVLDPYGYHALFTSDSGVALVSSEKWRHYGDRVYNISLNIPVTLMYSGTWYNNKAYLSTGINSFEADIYSFAPNYSPVTKLANLPTPGIETCQCIASDKSGNIYIGTGDDASPTGRVYKSTDLGVTWSMLYDTNISCRISAIAISDSGDVYYSSTNFPSFNGTAKVWKNGQIFYEPLGETLFHIELWKNGNITILGSEYTSNVTKPRLWSMVYGAWITQEFTPSSSGNRFNSFVKINDTTGFAITMRGTIYKTSDSGETWTHMVNSHAESTDSNWSIGLLNTNTLIMCRFSDSQWFTTDLDVSIVNTYSMPISIRPHNAIRFFSNKYCVINDYDSNKSCVYNGNTWTTYDLETGPNRIYDTTMIGGSFFLSTAGLSVYKISIEPTYKFMLYRNGNLIEQRYLKIQDYNYHVNNAVTSQSGSYIITCENEGLLLTSRTVTVSILESYKIITDLVDITVNERETISLTGKVTGGGLSAEGTIKKTGLDATYTSLPSVYGDNDGILYIGGGSNNDSHSKVNMSITNGDTWFSNKNNVLGFKAVTAVCKLQDGSIMYGYDNLNSTSGYNRLEKDNTTSLNTIVNGYSYCTFIHQFSNGNIVAGFVNNGSENNRGIVLSKSNGTSWTYIERDGLSSISGAIAIIPLSGTGAVVAFNTGRIYRTYDSGDTWTMVSRPSSLSTGTFTIGRISPTKIVFGSKTENLWWISTDECSNWNPTTIIPQMFSSYKPMDYSNGYSIIHDSFGRKFAYSTDEGITWTTVTIPDIGINKVNDAKLLNGYIWCVCGGNSSGNGVVFRTPIIPTYKCEWFKNNSLISGETKFNTTGNFNYTKTNAQVGDSGTYKFRVTNNGAILTSRDSNVTVIDYWFTVRFLDYNGTVLSTQDIMKGTNAVPPTVSRTGYDFTGWDKSYNNITSDIDITAQYTLSFSIKTQPKSKNVQVGDNVSLSAEVMGGYKSLGVTKFLDLPQVVDYTVTALYFDSANDLYIGYTNTAKNHGLIKKRFSSGVIDDLYAQTLHGGIINRMAKLSDGSLVYSESGNVAYGTNRMYKDGVQTWSGSGYTGGWTDILFIHRFANDNIIVGTGWGSTGLLLSTDKGLTYSTILENGGGSLYTCCEVDGTTVLVGDGNNQRGGNNLYRITNSGLVSSVVFTSPVTTHGMVAVRISDSDFILTDSGMPGGSRYRKSTDKGLTWSSTPDILSGLHGAGAYSGNTAYNASKKFSLIFKDDYGCLIYKNGITTDTGLIASLIHSNEAEYIWSGTSIYQVNDGLKYDFQWYKNNVTYGSLVTKYDDGISSVNFNPVNLTDTGTYKLQITNINGNIRPIKKNISSYTFTPQIDVKTFSVTNETVTISTLGYTACNLNSSTLPGKIYSFSIDVTFISAAQGSVPQIIFPGGGILLNDWNNDCRIILGGITYTSGYKKWEIGKIYNVTYSDNNGIITINIYDSGSLVHTKSANITNTNSHYISFGYQTSLSVQGTVSFRVNDLQIIGEPYITLTSNDVSLNVFPNFKFLTKPYNITCRELTQINVSSTVEGMRPNQIQSLSDISLSGYSSTYSVLDNTISITSTSNGGVKFSEYGFPTISFRSKHTNAASVVSLMLPFGITLFTDGITDNVGVSNNGVVTSTNYNVSANEWIYHSISYSNGTFTYTAKREGNVELLSTVLSFTPIKSIGEIKFNSSQTTGTASFELLSSFEFYSPWVFFELYHDGSLVKSSYNTTGDFTYVKTVQIPDNGNYELKAYNTDDYLSKTFRISVNELMHYTINPISETLYAYSNLNLTGKVVGGYSGDVNTTNFSNMDVRFSTPNVNLIISSDSFRLDKSSTGSSVRWNLGKQNKVIDISYDLSLSPNGGSPANITALHLRKSDNSEIGIFGINLVSWNNGNNTIEFLNSSKNIPLLFNGNSEYRVTIHIDLSGDTLSTVNLIGINGTTYNQSHSVTINYTLYDSWFRDNANLQFYYYTSACNSVYTNFQMSVSRPVYVQKLFKDGVDLNYTIVNETGDFNYLKTGEDTDTGAYQIKAWNGIDTAVSTIADIVVNNRLRIVKQPENVGITVGQNLIISIEVDGGKRDFNYVYELYKNGVKIHSLETASKVYTYVKESIPSDNAQYYVKIVKNDETIISDTITVTITSTFKFVTEPNNILNFVNTGINNIISRVSGGVESTYSFKWLFNNTEVLSSTSDGDVSLPIDSKDYNNGLYDLEVKNRFETLIYEDVSVQFKKHLEIISHSIGTTLWLGKSLTINCEARYGLYNVYTYKLYKDGNLINSVTNTSTTYTYNKLATVNDSGWYSIEIINGPETIDIDDFYIFVTDIDWSLDYDRKIERRKL